MHKKRWNDEYQFDMREDFMIKNDLLPPGDVVVEIVDVDTGISRQSKKAIVRVTIRYTDPDGRIFDSTQAMSTQKGSMWMWKHMLECIPDSHRVDAAGITHVVFKDLIGKHLIARCQTSSRADPAGHVRQFTQVLEWKPLPKEEEAEDESSEFENAGGEETAEAEV